MPFQIIRGTYHVVGYSPDGDSIRFKADDNALWSRLSGPPVKINGRGHAQLRLEGIDTLETHFGLGLHQPLPHALSAVEQLLADLDIRNVDWSEDRSVVTSADDGVHGFILARAVEDNRRPVSFAFRGNPPGDGGSSIHFDSDLLRDSVNFRQIARGLAYPTYYRGLFSDLRRTLTAATEDARQQRLGVWQDDRTLSGFEVPSLSAVTDDHVILPKLFRRIADFLSGGGSIHGFRGYLAALIEPVLHIPNAHSTHFDTFVEVDGIEVRMTVPPEELIFG